MKSKEEWAFKHLEETNNQKIVYVSPYHSFIEGWDARQPEVNNLADKLDRAMIIIISKTDFVDNESAKLLFQESADLLKQMKFRGWKLKTKDN